MKGNELNCPLCSYVCHPFIDPQKETKYYHCGHCQLIFKSPLNYQTFSEQKMRYDLHQNNEENDGYRAYFRRFLDFVLENIDDVEYALDFGCGASTLLAKILGEEKIACDVFDPIYHPDRSYMEHRYDLIVSVEVFEHLHDPKGIFEHLLGRLKDGGYLAIQTEFSSHDTEEFLKWYYRLDPTHIMFFRENTFRYLSDLYGCNYRTDNGKNILIIQK